jgi:hypothetical protein
MRFLRNFYLMLKVRCTLGIIKIITVFCFVKRDASVKLFELLSSFTISRVQGEWDLEMKGVAFDSRKVNPSDHFACLTGTAQDAHAFVHDVIGRGRLLSLPSGNSPFRDTSP